MKFKVTFKEFVNEEDSYAIVATGKDSNSLDNRMVVDTINAALERVTKDNFITPYIGLGSIAKVLAYASIILPQHIILDNEAGEVVFEVTNFGAQLTDRNPNIDGNLTDVAYYVYFEYARDDDGKYIVFAQLVSSEELEELLHTDLDGDNEEGESPEHQAIVKGGLDEAIKPVDKFITDLGRPRTIKNGDKVLEIPRYAVMAYDPAKGKHQVIETHHHLGYLQRKHGVGTHRVIKIGGEKSVKESLQQIDEISKQKLHRYIYKAQDEIDTRVADVKKEDQKIRDLQSIGVEPRIDTVGDHFKNIRLLIKRVKGQETAKRKYLKGGLNLPEENIQEISSKKLGQYVSKAGTDVSKHYTKIGIAAALNDKKAVGYHLTKTLNREKGIDKAANTIIARKHGAIELKRKMDKIDEEPLDEISRYKLNQYINRANTDAVDHILSAGEARRAGKPDKLYKHMEVVKKRISGVEQAKIKRDKKPKEIGEETLDEISKQKLGDYIKRASDDIMHHSYEAGQRRKGSNTPDPDKKTFKRRAGIRKATDKLTKEPERSDRWFEDRYGKKPKAASWGPKDEVAELGPDGKAVQPVNEVLTKSDSAGKWIKDFVKSKNPKFKGKSPEKRKQQALAAYYSARGKIKKTPKLPAK